MFAFIFLHSHCVVREQPLIMKGFLRLISTTSDSYINVIRNIDGLEFYAICMCIM